EGPGHCIDSDTETDSAGIQREGGTGVIPLASAGGQLARSTKVELAAGLAELPVITVGFPGWPGVAPSTWSGSYRSKPLVDVGGGGEFAERAVCRILRQEGWQAAWLDTYRRRVVGQIQVVECDETVAFVRPVLPAGVLSLLEGITGRMAADRNPA